MPFPQVSLSPFLIFSPATPPPPTIVFCIIYIPGLFLKMLLRIRGHEQWIRNTDCTWYIAGRAQFRLMGQSAWCWVAAWNRNRCKYCAF